MKEKFTSRVLPFAYSLEVPNKGWKADLFYFDKEENALKQAQFTKLYITLKSRCNSKVCTLYFETAEKDGTIESREIADRTMSGIMKNFFGSEEDYKNTEPLTTDNKVLDISEWFPVLIPFAAKIVKDTTYRFVSAFRYKWEDNKVVRAYFDVPTEYVYTAESGLTPLQPFVCPPDTYPTEEECRDSVKINVCRFGEKLQKAEPKTAHIIAVDGVIAAVDDDTCSKVKNILILNQ